MAQLFIAKSEYLFNLLLQEEHVHNEVLHNYSFMFEFISKRIRAGNIIILFWVLIYLQNLIIICRSKRYFVNSTSFL